jgi:DNA-binding transcriptional regulator YiaG
MNTKAAIHALRERTRFTPQEVAEYLGVSVHLVRKWESGTREFNPTVARLFKLLGLVRDLAPDVHSIMLPEGRKEVVVKRDE